MKVTLFAALASAALLTISCGGVVDPSQNQSETYTDTLQPGATLTRNFNVSKSGEYSIQVDSATPAPANNIIGVGFGQVISGACSPFTLNGFATVGRTGSAGAIQQGSWCAIIYDSGTIAVATAIQVTIKHP
jgi:hypothetical protein